MTDDITIAEAIVSIHPHAALAEGFDDAIIGLRYGTSVVVYDIHKMSDILTSRDGFTKDEAEEYLEKNIFKNHLDQDAPYFVYTFENQKP